MEAESQRNAGETDDTGATPDPVKVDRQIMIERLQLEDEEIRLVKRLELNSEQLAALGKLDGRQRRLWFLALKESFAPEDWLTGIDEAIQEAKPVPAFHVPTAEGIATYPGLLGTNGSSKNGDKRDREVKDFILGLLRNAISRLPEEDGNSNGHANGNGNGNGAGNGAEEEAESEQQS